MTYWLIRWRENGREFSVDFDTKQEAEDEKEGLEARGVEWVWGPKEMD